MSHLLAGNSSQIFVGKTKKPVFFMFLAYGPPAANERQDKKEKGESHE